MTGKLIAPLTEEQCKVNLCKELGPAQLTLTPYCSEESVIRIPCSYQREDLNLTIGSTFIETRNQCSVTPRRLESEKKMMLDVSLGCGANNPWILAAILNTKIEKHPLRADRMVLPIRDNIGQDPKYWQVEIEPIEEGKVSDDWRVVILYAQATTEEAQFVFSPETVRTVPFQLMGYQHPTQGIRGYIEYKRSAFPSNGSDVPFLKAGDSTQDLALAAA